MKARTIGSGWHSQSVRHSNARRFGHAGGLYAPRGSLPSDIVASDKYYDREQLRYQPYTNVINNAQAKRIIDALNDKNQTNVSIRYLKQDEPVIFTQGKQIYTTPNTLLTPLGIAHEYAHTISSDESGHDKEFENNLSKVVNDLPRKYGRKQNISAKKILERAKNPLEQHLALAVHHEKNSAKKKELLFILRELEKADTQSAINRWYHQYKYNIQTLGISIPIAVIAPLVVSGTIIGATMGTTTGDKAVAQGGMYATASYIGALATKGTIQNIKLIKEQKKNLYLDTLTTLQDRKDLTPKEKQVIAKRVSEEMTIEKVPEVKKINDKIQEQVI